MKRYEDAELEVIAFDAEDIITTSMVVEVDSEEVDFQYYAKSVWLKYKFPCFPLKEETKNKKIGILR